MSTVELRAVSKRYGDVVALHDVTLEIAEGEFFALLGPSGSGKTTLLRAVAGFVAPDSGQVCLGGEPMNNVPVNRRHIGMVFQHYALFPHMNVRDNVAFGLDVRRAGRDATRRRVDAMLELVELSGLDQRRPAELSGGQQQRVAIARALVTEPRVLLLDEPLGALDRRLRQQMQVELRRIQQDVGITALFVTHDQEEALTLSDRVALLDQGAVVQVGSPTEVYEAPRSRFAAAFLGDANFFTGHCEGGALVTASGTRLAVQASRPGEEKPGGGEQVTVAVRPEKITLQALAAGTSAVRAQENALDGEVLRVVYAGNSVSYRVRCADTQLTVFEQNRSGTPFNAGQRVRCTWAAQHTVMVAS